MTSEWKHRLHLTLTGESHGEAGVSATLTGLPAGIAVDGEGLKEFLARRRGGTSLTTPRKEPDVPCFESGLCDGVTDGAPLTVRIANTNTRSQDYSGFSDTPRPSHADYTVPLRFGEVDMRGGGHFSGRLTAPLAAVGYVCLCYLRTRGIHIGSHLARVGDVCDLPFDPVRVGPADFAALRHAPFPTLSAAAGEDMRAQIAAASAAGDSVGGVAECAIAGMPAGYGDPLFDGLENTLARLLFSLGGVRGVEFGTGFAAASLRGSVHNDPYCIVGGEVRTVTNHAGGIQAGISNGMPILFRVAFKPTASISLPQQTVSLSRKKECTLTIQGRHDPCIALRALPGVESLAAIAVCDALL